MPTHSPKFLLFVHGWSVTHTRTYGRLPERLQAEIAALPPLAMEVRHVYLARYVSFRDEVTVQDLARAFDAAVRDTLGKELGRGARFACITHSTGAPVLREWWDRFYRDSASVDYRPGEACPLSHLLMLAPANAGSALAQLGKTRLSEAFHWLKGVEPGTGVLNWLELASPESFELNRRWVERYSLPWQMMPPVYPFVLTGQRIDRRLYDFVNSYTGEVGSDGVVRVASANLNMTYLQLTQTYPENSGTEKRPRYESAPLEVTASAEKSGIAFLIVPGCSHVGTKMGIIESVKNDAREHPTVSAILDCLRVNDAGSYHTLARAFDARNDRLQALDPVEGETNERTERENLRLRPDRFHINDPHSMLMFRVRDDRGHSLEAFKLLLTGEDDGPDSLPVGFLDDRQGNRQHRGSLTFYVNHALMVGCGQVKHGEQVLREARQGLRRLGVAVSPFRDVREEFVHHVDAALSADVIDVSSFLKKNQSTLVDIVMRRVVRKGTFALTDDTKPTSFKRQSPGAAIE